MLRLASLISSLLGLAWLGWDGVVWGVLWVCQKVIILRPFQYTCQLAKKIHIY